MNDAMICKCCGGKISPYNMRCEYCGTSYNRDISTYKIESYQAPVDHYSACFAMDMDAIMMFGAENAAKVCLEHLTHELSKSIMNDIKLSTHYNPVTDQKIIRGDIKLIRPVDAGRSDLFV